MKERPILFSAPMVRALLAGTKTQTRRVVKPVGNDEGFVITSDGNGWWPYRSADGETSFYRDLDGYDMESQITCPYGQPGDRLWVREAFEDCESALHSCVIYRADGGAPGTKWTPSIHMPRWASRITLEVTAVRVERLQDISEADALAEGVDKNEPNRTLSCIGQKVISGPVAEYSALWESINGPGSWDANPWVWVVEFKRVEGGAA